MRLSERAGGYQIAVFTDPTPLRAGPVDVSVFVQDAETGEPAAEGVEWHGASGAAGPARRGRRHAGDDGAATNKLFRSALFELPETGWWDIEATVDGGRGQARIRFDRGGRRPSSQLAGRGAVGRLAGLGDPAVRHPSDANKTAGAAKGAIVTASASAMNLSTAARPISWAGVISRILHIPGLKAGCILSHANRVLAAPSLIFPTRRLC